jgi:hypothetical protein
MESMKDEMGKLFKDSQKDFSSDKFLMTGIRIILVEKLAMWHRVKKKILSTIRSICQIFIKRT